MLIRPESPTDIAAIRGVHIAAFPTPAEADLVDQLRASGRNVISLMAIDAERVVGHLLFTSGRIESVSGVSRVGLALAPLAVIPELQRRGIGTALMRGGIEACRTSRVPFVFVLGHPEYYHRFGFRRASDWKIGNEYNVDEPFMILVLDPAAVPCDGGIARYAPEFASLD